MSRILLQTTIPEHPDDWDISRFSLLADELRAAGHEVIARNRADRGEDDPVLSGVDELDYDQLWLMAVDVGDGLTAADADAIVRFRENGGGVLTARDHEDLGSCLLRLGSLGMVNQFHDKNVDPSARGRGVGGGPLRHGARTGPKHRDRPPLQPRRSAGRRARAGRPTHGQSARRVNFPPLRRLQLGSRLRGALIRHRAVGHRNQGRPVPPSGLQGLRAQHRDVAASADEPTHSGGPV